MLSLSDTVDKMIYGNYKERVAAEYEQLSIRIADLKDMLRKWENGTLSFTPASPRLIYLQQLSTMEKYKDILKCRAQIENIDLFE